jgi:PAS domain S-box-containing protein
MNKNSRIAFSLFVFLYLSLYLAWLLAGPGGELERFLVGNLAMIFTSLVCAWLAYRAWRSSSDRRSKQAWGWLTLGLLAWLCGDMARMALEGFNVTPRIRPTALDILFSIGALSLLVGLFYFPRTLKQHPGRLRLGLDLTITTTAVVCLGWIFVLQPVMNVVTAGKGPVGALLYPVADLILLVTLLELFLLNEPGSFPTPLTWVLLGLAAYATSDLAYTYIRVNSSYLAGSPVDFGWTIGDGFIMAAALSFLYSKQTSAIPGPAPALHVKRIAERIQSILPLLATVVLGFYSIFEWQLSGKLDQLGLWTTVVLGVAIIGRQGIATGEVEFQQYARLVDSIAEPAFICDPQGNLRLVNPALLQIVGYEQADALLGLPLQLLVRPAQDVQRMLEMGGAKSSGWNGEIFLCRHDGQLVPVILALRPVDGIVGNRNALAGTAHDLSEIKRQQAALQQAYEQIANAHAALEKLNSQLELRVLEKTANLTEAYAQLERQNAALRNLDRLKSDFVSMVSHELRAPLTNINGGVELVMARAHGLPENARQTLSIVQAEILRLSRFIETILDLSALDAGRAPVYPAPLLLQKVIDNIKIQLLHIPNGERIHWQTDPATEIMADERALNSILFHLLDNAMKYAPTGAIWVTSGSDLASEQAWIRVEDEGEGIDPSDLPLLFTAFFRSRASDAQTVYGHGLGLYIVQRLVEAMNGKMEAENREEGGACFTCWLPMVIEEETGEENEFEDFAS